MESKVNVSNGRYGKRIVDTSLRNEELCESNCVGEGNIVELKAIQKLDCGERG